MSSDSPPHASLPSRLDWFATRVVVECVLAGYLVLALGWWWLTPGGFPVSHLRFWSNQVWPLALTALSSLGLWWTARRDSVRAAACLAACGVLAISAACVAAMLFFDIRRMAPFAAAILGLLQLGLALFVGGRFWRIRSALPLMACGAFLGASIVFAQRAAPATTRPLDLPAAWAAIGENAVGHELPPMLSASPRTQIYASPASVLIRLGKVRLELEPMLTFISTSRSGGWSILSRWTPRSGPIFQQVVGKQDSTLDGLAMVRLCGAHDWLEVRDDGAIRVTAISQLQEPVYSHLNSFCQLTIYGASRLELEFSPTGSQCFTPQPADYPVGRPAQFAYLDVQRKFHVVQARSGEKGPFREMATGDLGDGDPFTMHLVDAGQRIASLQMDDWPRQLSTALSPTAGWGVPVNAIEFQKVGDRPGDPVMLWMSLAGTSVGRGWDTVGHAAGVYRNQIVIESAESPSP